MANINQLREELENTPMGVLRGIASKQYDLKVNPKSLKSDIIELIVAKVQSGSMVMPATGQLQPGWARIKLHQTDRHSDADVQLVVNNYKVFIPMNKEIDVPLKVLEALRLAEEQNYSARKGYTPGQGNADSGDNVNSVVQYSYPHSVLGIVDGPDPRPTPWEISREQLIKAKRAYQKATGQWPQDKKAFLAWQAKNPRNINDQELR